MGIVWLASDEYLHRDVAIKEIQPRGREIRDSDPEVRRALREARAAAKLSEHPGIITVHDVATDEHGLPWIVMQLLNGRSLGVALDADGTMAVDKAARIGIQVLRALDYAHNAGVLHRDVKPGNVMLVGERGDQVVLTDFGIAVIDGASVLTATGQLPGAPEYIAPERIIGEEALPAADVWSVGIMLYKMVVGQTPFHRGDVQATLSAALTREPDPDPKVGRLAPVIKGLLSKKPAERMTAGQAVDRLTEIAALPGEAPAGVRVRLEYSTREENPAGEVTVVDETVPNTRIDPPPFTPLPSPAMPVAPDAPTLDPMSPRPRSRRGPLIAGGAVAAVAVVVAAVVLVDTGDTAGSPTTQQSTTTTVPDVPLRNYGEALGFEIDIPLDWRREASTDGPLSYVIWKGEQTDPKVGALEVQVLRDTTRSGVPAMTYLTDQDRTKKANRENADYKRLALSDNRSSADLEYTYRAATGNTHYHVQTRAFAPDDVYTLTFSLFANDTRTLAEQWRAAEPLIDEIRAGFRLTS